MLQDRRRELLPSQLLSYQVHCDRKVVWRQAAVVLGVREVPVEYCELSPEIDYVDCLPDSSHDVIGQFCPREERYGHLGREIALPGRIELLKEPVVPRPLVCADVPLPDARRLGGDVLGREGRHREPLGRRERAKVR